MLNHLQNWYSENRSDLERQGLATTLTLGPVDRTTSAGWLDVDSTDRVGRITVWDTGEAVLAVAAVSSRSIVLEEVRALASPTDLRDAMHVLVNAVRNSTGRS